MKDYKEMAERVLARRDEYNVKRDKHIKNMKKGILGLTCLCAITVGISMADGQSKRQGVEVDKDTLLDVAANEESEVVFPPFSQPCQKLSESQNGVNTGENQKDLTENPIASSEGSKVQEQVSGTELREDMPSSECGICIEWFSTRNMTEECWRFFGGVYHDENGKLGLYLTENTKENRALICKQMGVDEKIVTFRTAQYTYRYLNDVHDKISQAMVKKELPFVVSAAVYDDRNRIVVCVATDNKKDISKVLEYDTLGGAIIIEYGKCGVTEKLKY